MAVVQAPDGTDHTVDIEWIGNRLRRVPREVSNRVRTMGRGTAQVAEGGDAGCFPDVGDFFVGLAILVAVVVVVIFVIPIAWGLLEALVIVVLATVVWFVRVMLHRPWTVIHRGADGVVVDQWVVVGWRQAKRVVTEATASVAATGRARVDEAPEHLD